MDRNTDLTGMVFNKLTVLSPNSLTNRIMTSMWNCRCECGRERIVSAQNLKHGAVKSCGCTKGLGKKTHGMTNSPEYGIWQQIKERCYNENAASYPNYGGRGIVMWKDWLLSFAQFYADMGPRPSPKHSIERIDNDGHYEPSNCRWATYAEQARNKRNSVVYNFNGVPMTLTDIAAALGMKRTTLDYRIRRGKSFEEAILPKA